MQGIVVVKKGGFERGDVIFEEQKLVGMQHGWSRAVLPTCHYCMR